MTTKPTRYYLPTTKAPFGPQEVVARGLLRIESPRGAEIGQIPVVAFGLGVPGRTVWYIATELYAPQPEPGLSGVALDRFGVAWQRTLDETHSPDDDCWSPADENCDTASWTWLEAQRGPMTILHPGRPAPELVEVPAPDSDVQA